MTTPRDDIAGLIKKLKDERIDRAWYLRQKAATQLDALSARVKELEEHKVELYQRAINSEARALRAEQERDKSKSNIKMYYDYWRDELTRSNRLRQELDEAYERAAGILRERMGEQKELLARLTEPETRSAVQGSLDQLLICLVDIRRLAGPEKIAAADDGEERR